MLVSAKIENAFQQHTVLVKTNGNEKYITIPSKENGYGSSVNGGEMLMLALATCYCNDIYREAANRNMVLRSVEVEVSGSFGSAGEAGKDFSYKANVDADAGEDEIRSLLLHTDAVAEIHNTLRQGLEIKLVM